MHGRYVMVCSKIPILWLAVQQTVNFADFHENIAISAVVFTTLLLWQLYSRNMVC